MRAHTACYLLGAALHLSVIHVGRCQRPRDKITLNGSDFSVRANLFAALQMLRDKTREATEAKKEWIFSAAKYRPEESGWWDGVIGTVHFWIDAICINQDDLLERGHQVGMMRNIFSAADLVVAWLGLFDPGLSHAALHCIMDDTVRDHKHSAPGAPPSWAQQKDGILQLKRLPYWRRMWIVQEFVLPRRLVAVWNQQGVWVRNLCMVFDMGSGVRSGDPGFYVETLCRERIKREFRLTGSFDQLLEAFQYGECVDPRDRVYALLGLAHQDDISQELEPDYTISATQLYFRTLSCVRHSPYLVDEAPWNSFRRNLKASLLVPSDGIYVQSEVVYCISEPDRRLAQPLIHLLPGY